MGGYGSVETLLGEDLCVFGFGGDVCGGGEPTAAVSFDHVSAVCGMLTVSEQE